MSNRWINNLLQNCIQFESMAALTADTDQTLYTFHPDLFNIGPIPKWLHGRMPGYCMDCHYRADACYCDWPAPICVTDPKCRVSVACGATPSMQWVSALCHSRNRGGGARWEPSVLKHTSSDSPLSTVVPHASGFHFLRGPCTTWMSWWECYGFGGSLISVSNWTRTSPRSAWRLFCWDHWEERWFQKVLELKPVENVVVHRSDDCCSLHFEFGFPHHFHFTSPTPIPNSPDQMSQDCTLTDSKALTYNLLSCFQDTNSYVHCLCCYPCCYSCNNHNVVWKIVKYAWEAWSHGKLWWVLINLNFAWKMVKYAWEAWSHRKLWWRLIAILTCKSFVVLGYGGERLIEPSSNWFPPKFPSG